jgi:hypothetical protein
MSFKSIDLQMSIPRTPEASGYHGQQLHKPVTDQNRLANVASDQTVELRHKSTGLQETTGQTIRDRQKENESQLSGQAKRPDREEEGAEEEESVPQQHPYKGKHIDISL